MLKFFNWIGRMWLIYALIAIICLLVIIYKEIRVQRLNCYRSAAQGLAACSSNQACDDFMLKRGIRYYSELAMLYPNVMETYNALGYCYYHLKEYRRAADSFTKAISRDPDDFVVRYNKALALIRLNEWRQAVDVLEGSQEELKLLNRPEAIEQVRQMIALIKDIEAQQDPIQRAFMIKQLGKILDLQDVYYYLPVYKFMKNGQEQMMW